MSQDSKPIKEQEPDENIQEMMLGDLLVRRGFITRHQLKEALEEQKTTGQYLGEVMLRRGYVSRANLGAVLEEKLGVEYVSLGTLTIPPEIVRLIPERLAREYQCIPIERVDGKLSVAMVDPMNLEAIQAVRLATGLEVKPLFTTELELQQAMNQFYDVKQIAFQAIEASSRGDDVEETSVQELEAMVEEAPIVRLVNSIITGAMAQSASDIHLEPTSNEMQVRYRVDGMLYTAMTVPRRIQAAVVSRVKIISGMDIAERRLPQDGRVTFASKGKEVDLRVSTLCTVHGEKVVMRILDKDAVIRRLADLGLQEDQLPILESLVTKPYGMILVTGPTGSGKTTTLYAVLNRLNERTKNIVTIEDPVEYKVFGLNQVQVNPGVGITFANGLRAILRQDPNIILVGEIRDKETAEISIQSALTGHLVLSTLHTNDAPSAIARLLDMEIEPFLTASSIIGIVAQRLARLICRDCREAYQPPIEVLRDIRMDPPPEGFFRGKGCKTCNGTGFHGRTAVYEIMRLNDTIRELVLHRAPSSEIRKAAIASGMKEMRSVGFDLVRQGLTTPEEIMRVVYVDHD